MALLFARALPRVEPSSDPKSLYERIDEWFGRLPLHHIDDRANAAAFKFLRRMRIVVMKIDHRLVGYLDRVKRSGRDRAHVQEMLDHVQGPFDPAQGKLFDATRGEDDRIEKSGDAKDGA
jgi:hypothetical protein